MTKPDNFTVLDLFCGAGGLSLGFVNAGFTIVQAIDCCKPALETYNLNIGKHAEESDLYYGSYLSSASVILGGPPCQGFSSAGRRENGDRRNTLVSRFSHIVAHFRPQAFVFENVEGFLTAENGDRLFELLDPLIESGYCIHLRKVNAANYGVPQHRKRVIAIGGLGWEPTFPSFTHSAYGAPGAHRATTQLPPTPAISQALMSLPEPATKAPGIPQGHVAKSLRDVELQRAISLQPGQSMRDLPEELQHESFQRRASRRVMDGTPTEKRGGAPAGIKRLKGDEPSKAITSGMLGEFLHPTEHRPLTVRECARLQTFPDDFVFLGSLSQQMQLIANAVSPLFAQKIASSLLNDMYSSKKMVDRGCLVSFVPTLADAMSPILKQVTNLVKRRYMRSQVVESLTLWG